jgi:TolA-binding protein
MKNHMEHSALPSPEEIRKYQEGKLNAARSHEIELIAQENPLLADAIEGFGGNPAYHLLPGITAAVSTAAGVASTTGVMAGAAAGVVKATSPWWHLNGWIIGATAGTSVAVGTYYINENIQEKKQITANQTTSLNPVETQTTDIVSYDALLESVETADEPAQSVSALSGTNQYVQQSELVKTGNEVEKGSALIDDNSKSNVPQKISSISGPGIIQGSQSQKDDAPRPSSTVAINIMKVLNYKMADYTAIRSNTWEKFSAEENGLPAKWESEAERVQFQKDHPELIIPYIEYVTTCISAFDNGKYQVAIDRFGIILDQYPDDVNAQFYSAMSHYHLKNQQGAIALFLKVEKNVIRTFNEEAFFYHAKCAKEVGDPDTANSLFVKVAQMNGFYKERALEEMQ